MGTTVALASMPKMSSQGVKGIVIADATAYTTYSCTAPAGGWNNLTLDQLVGLRISDYVQIDGAGTAGVPHLAPVIQVGAQYTGTGTTLAIVQQRPTILAVTAQPLVAFVSVYTRFMPHKVRIVNINTGTVWEWFYGMPGNSAIKTSVAGGVQLLSTSAIFVDQKGFYFHPSPRPPWNWQAST